MRIITKSVAVTTAGSDAAAVGSGTLDGMTGLLLDVWLDYHATAPATTDVTIAYTTRGGSIAVISNNATDMMVVPRQNPSTESKYPIDQSLTVSVAGSNALTACVTAWFRILLV